MSENKDKSAFGYGFANEQSYQEVTGLTKREYFAAMAMQGFLSIYDADSILPNEDNVKYMAKLAVKAADILLQELEEQQ